ncbi:MAG: winged helix-turn-helix domain-containing protein [Donghicola eburneus]|nr:winged helix-turn-helix domain-containing protein [Donghicola eburneus]MCI5038580.1 winged helix-turn-helix domain-containing protein [Donghicola eburneus]
MDSETERPALRLRIVFGQDAMLGPGKAELLERIDRTGSISAAGREMGMSYKRAWLLVGTMNTMFREPVVHSARGGSNGGGATLTPLGAEVLRLYRAVEASASAAGSDEIGRLQDLLADMATGK